MGLSKIENFNLEQTRTAELARALGHPARIAILKYLSNTHACVCGDLVEVLPLSQSTVSQHLKELKKAGFIKGTIAGTNVCYCINSNVWQEASDTLSSLFSKFNNDSCC